jgi:molecular chaperone DnaK
MIDDLLQRTINVVDATLHEAGKDASSLDQVVLVGGSTRIPKVQELISSRIPGKINREINPDEVVAAGAAIQGGILAGEVDEIVLLDVTPLTLSIETIGGIATPLIERNTTIPTEKSKTFTTAEDNQPAVQIHVVQGERKMVADNKSLGTFQLAGIPPAPRGIPQIDVTFNIDADGILHVTAKDKATSKSASITIQDSSRLDDSEIERMRKEAEEHADEDKKKAELIETRNQGDQTIYAVEKAMSDLGEKVDSAKRSEIEDQIRQLRDKLSQDASLQDLKQAIEMLSKASQEIAQQAYQDAQKEGGASDATGSSANADSASEDDGEYIDAEYDEKE